MSMSILIGLLNLIADGRYKEYYKNLRQNKFFLGILLFFILHIIALLWSDNLEYGFNDVRRKLSLIAVPIILISKPVDYKRDYKTIVFFFISALIITSVINAVSYFYYEQYFEFKDLRDMSLFNSHIRYAIMIALGIPLLLEFKRGNKSVGFLIIILVLWLLFYTYISQVLTGLISIFTILLAYILFKLIVEKKIKSLWFLILSSIVGLGFLFVALFSESEQKVTSKVNYIGMQSEWVKKSNMDFNGLDHRNQKLKYTLSRFLDSKGLASNKEGVRSLTTKEIQAIENGMANASEMKIGFWGRLEGLRYQLHYSNDPNGHSLLQRIEAWETGIAIYSDHYILGVGTGDVDDAFKHKYVENKSKLIPKNQIRAHNTYLTILLTFGVIGLLLFSFIIISFLKSQLDYKQMMGFIFMMVMLFTLFFEDTLETQTGITLFSFFAALYSIPARTSTND